MSTEIFAHLFAHLGQSTLCALVAGLLALALRRNRASVRYWIWFASSAKFLVPFALLAWLGTLMPHRPASRPVPPGLVAAIEQFSQPFALSLPTGGPVPAPKASHNYLAAIALAVWASGFAVVAVFWTIRWKRVHSLRRQARPVTLPSGVEISAPVMSAPDLLEPGVFGVLRPVLLLPEGIADRLDQTQLDAILAHESCHIRRKDNLTAAIHMAVQAIFWFHPLTWWIGTRLIDEREKACDEEVLGLGYKPGVYAESILAICKLYLESPLACVSGVTGSDLKKRIEAIMKNRMTLSLSFGKKLALSAAGMAALAAPVAIGILLAQDEPDWQTAAGGKMAFEVASVKPTKNFRPPNFPLDDRNAKTPGGRFSASFPLWVYISFAYKLAPNEEERRGAVAQLAKIVGNDFFDIEAQAPGNPTKDQMRLMMQSLLAERFKLAVHFETRDAPVFALTLVKPGKTGPKLVPHSEGPPCPDYTPPDLSAPPPPVGEVFPSDCETAVISGRNGVRLFGSRNTTMPLLAEAIQTAGGMDLEVDKLVVDQTGLKGKFDFTLEFVPGYNDINNQVRRSLGQAPPDAPPADPQGTPFLNAVREQLGLKLTPSKAMIKTLIVDHVEKPSEN
ncbi:MAG TPA: M56 family metallopeptidase [Bryobacteraceae bacterium]